MQKEWIGLSSVTIPSNFDRISLILRIQDIPSLELEIISDPNFAKTSKRKINFLAACESINTHIYLNDVNVKCPFGGLIGMDDSQLERIFCFAKIMQLHTVLHDATGYIKRHSNEGPVYFFVWGTHSPQFLNTCLFERITGMSLLFESC